MDNEQVVSNEIAEQNEGRDNREQRDPKANFRNKRRKKVCAFCADKIDFIDYKDTVRIRKNLSERAKILPRRVTGTCARHQRQLTIAVKRARHLALIPYITD
ncbi:MAG: 30S ribosomal protein S18 [Clostridiales bacterium]|nr:30S ribosomal protein S18 [Candidatus Coliplasma equi]